MVASGNDFVIIENSPHSTVHSPQIFAKKICDRKYGIGADGLLLLEKSKTADIKMRIFNADGSEAEMCGNGARCAALYSARNQQPVTSNQKRIKIETRAGVIEAQAEKDNVRIKLTTPKNIKLDIPLKINNRLLEVNFVNTGVPHTVIFVEGLGKIDVKEIGREIRHHKEFKPQGTNVNFVEILNNNSIKVRTYERGVEDETLACGTGAAAAALLYAIRYTLPTGRQALYPNRIDVQTQGGEILKVYFDRVNKGFKNVWLEGKVKIVYTGVYNV